jgi:hypothetical protein
MIPFSPETGKSRGDALNSSRTQVLQTASALTLEGNYAQKGRWETLGKQVYPQAIVVIFDVIRRGRTMHNFTMGDDRRCLYHVLQPAKCKQLGEGWDDLVDEDRFRI